MPNITIKSISVIVFIVYFSRDVKYESKYFSESPHPTQMIRNPTGHQCNVLVTAVVFNTMNVFIVIAYGKPF